MKEAGETFTVEDMYQRMINYAHWTVNARLLHECVKLLPSNIDIFDEMGVETMVLGDRYNFGFLNVHGFTEKNKGVNSFTMPRQPPFSWRMAWRQACSARAVKTSST